MVKSNQRITKIKRDPIEELLKKAEATPVENACTIQPQGMDLTSYPDMNNLRLWVHDYLLNGINATYINNIDVSGQTYLTTIVDGLPLFTKLTKSAYLGTGFINFNQPTLDSNGEIGGASFAVTADSEVVTYALNTDKLTTHGTPVFNPSTSIASNFSTSNYYTLPASTQSTDGTTYVFEFTPTETVNNLQRIAHFEFVLALEIQANGGPLISYCWDTGSSDVILDSVTPNTTYRVKIQVTSNKHRIVSLWQNGTWVKKINQHDPDIELSNNIYILHIGTGSMAQDQPLTDGTINMYNSYYYIDTEPDTIYRLATADSDMRACLATNSTNGYWQSNSDTTNHYIEYYNPEAIKLSSIEFNNYLCTDSSYIPTNFTIQGSNTGDASDWINIQTIENSNTTVGTNSPYSFDVSTQYSYKYFRIYINSPQSTVQIGYMKLVGTVERSQIPIEITKPGLWLSNLCKPYQVSYAGGWLRQNLINHSNKEFDTINSDTIGNYSFSFFQRGIIHRDAGSTHSDNDSYCQHWSPSALGCISHDSIIIPTNNLRNTYTSYQTLAVPSDVDKQSYFETMSKDVEFTFVDNNDNIPLSTTTFNGRVVGDGWQYEFVFEPNHGGSGNNYGETEEDVPNGSNGGCVTGQITYQLDNGDVCVQTIDKCFITDQALFNPYNHSTGDALNDKGEYILHRDWSGSCGRSIELYDGPGVVLGATTTISNCCGSARISLSYNTGDVYEGSECTTAYGAGSSTVRGDSAVAEGAGSSRVSVHNSDCCNSYGVEATLYFKEALEPQSNVTIYLNIWDLQKEYAAQGLPWAYTCEYDRFRVEISTQPCSDWYCKSFVIAENVDINDLGDISALQRIVFSGG